MLARLRRNKLCGQSEIFPFNVIIEYPSKGSFFVASQSHCGIIVFALLKGIEIPYPTITLHAQDGDAVLLQLSLSDPNNTADEDLEAAQFYIVPNTSRDASHAQSEGQHQVDGGSSYDPPAQMLYNAISACQELNPDSNQDDDNENHSAS